MASTSPILLILGAGPNVGQSVARAFAAKGYRIAVASRKATGKPDQLHIPSDFSNPSAVATAFAKVKEAYGIPSVVVYNGT
jgi:NAD(P)-dependent dehydrogenase (short-subunit alcohol dehydrogenase family)